jgi:hypothetical protein
MAPHATDDGNNMSTQAPMTNGETPSSKALSVRTTYFSMRLFAVANMSFFLLVAMMESTPHRIVALSGINCERSRGFDDLGTAIYLDQ